MPRLTAAPALLAAGWSLLMAAWLVGNPPFASPDEGSHYLRAIEVGRGHLITDRAPERALGGNEKALAFNRQLTYEVEVPAGLEPLPFGCYILEERAPAACIDGFDPRDEVVETVTPVGNYQPLPYLLPGVALRLGNEPAHALRWGRVPGAIVSLALLALAVALLWQPGSPLALAGPLVAVTPMALFCGASLTGSGTEIAAGIATIAAILRVTRDDPAPRWAWVAGGAAGALLALTRSLGPLWLLLALALFAALGGGRRWRRAKRPGLAAAGLLVYALLFNRAWEAAHGAEPPIGFRNLRGVLGDAVDEMWRASSELIGKFGYLEFVLPWPLYVAWFGMGFALIALALGAGTRRERLVLAGATAAALAIPMLLWIAAIRHTGVGLQGRYVLPVLVAVPLLGGEVLHRRRDRLPSGVARAVPLAAALVAGAGHLVAWYWNARRSAVGTDGPLLFLGDAEWSPPIGWGPWLALALVGAAAVAYAGVASGRSPRPPSPSPRAAVRPHDPR